MSKCKDCGGYPNGDGYLTKTVEEMAYEAARDYNENWCAEQKYGFANHRTYGMITDYSEGYKAGHAAASKLWGAEREELIGALEFYAEAYIDHQETREAISHLRRYGTSQIQVPQTYGHVARQVLEKWKR